MNTNIGTDPNAANFTQKNSQNKIQMVFFLFAIGVFAYTPQAIADVPYGVYARGYLEIQGPVFASAGPVEETNDFPGGSVGFNVPLGDTFCDVACANSYAWVQPGALLVSAKYTAQRAGYFGVGSTDGHFADYIIIDAPGLTGTTGTLNSLWLLKGEAGPASIASASIFINSGVYSTFVHFEQTPTYSIPFPNFTTVSAQFQFGSPILIYGVGSVAFSNGYYSSLFGNVEMQWIGVSAVHSDATHGVIDNYTIIAQSLLDYTRPITAPIPEANIYTMLLSGLCLLGIVVHRKKRIPN